jgi:hypothetical protein
MPVTREEVKKGVILQVMGPRYDRPGGTFGRVSQTGVFTDDNRWWFLLDWLTRFRKDAPDSMRLYEEDLPTFSLVTGPINLTGPFRPSKKRDPFRFKPPSPQLSFPFAEGLPRR